MLRTAAAKVAWVGRATVFLVGLSVILGLVLGVATMALAAVPGDPFKLGQSNVINAASALAGNVNNSMLRITNNSEGSSATALNLQVKPGKAPMTVNSDAKVANLNADKVDGQDSSAIGRELWAVINADGTIARSRGTNAFTQKLDTGQYQVVFTRSVENCAYVATTTDNFATPTGVVEGEFSGDVIVYTVNSAGTRVDLPFHLVVTCLPSLSWVVMAGEKDGRKEPGSSGISGFFVPALLHPGPFLFPPTPRLSSRSIGVAL